MNTTIDSMKTQARRLRDTLARSGENISHSRSLELVARQHGYRDWNTLHASLGNRPAGPPVTLGSKATGRYLGRPFTAKVLGVHSQLAPDRWRIDLQFETPVDVSAFDSFSVWRHRVFATVNADGATTEKTSNGVPQLLLDL